MSCLERRLVLWNEENLKEFLLEGRAIQNHLHSIGDSYQSDNVTQSFVKLMFSKKTAAALQLLPSTSGKECVLCLDDTIQPVPGSGKV